MWDLSKKHAQICTTVSTSKVKELWSGIVTDLAGGWLEVAAGSAIRAEKFLFLVVREGSLPAVDGGVLLMVNRLSDVGGEEG